MIYFTGDTHFGHAKVIQYASRPFVDAGEMDAEMVRRWNALVQPEDTVYHVGDVSLCKRARTLDLLAQLRGHKHLIFGNHDKAFRKDQAFLAHFESARDFAEIKAPDGMRRIVLCHYALRVWNKSHYGAWHLYGHSHGSLDDDKHALSLDVGVDCWAFAPVSYDAIKTRM
ncbi:MAG: metallophosphoesterase family protein, partial [Dehalococcoidia bacterium]|nr:metallophosphoesterase family protein [Dehalococcoidia bacterium]